MNRFLLAAALVGLAVPAMAQTAPTPLQSQMDSMPVQITQGQLMAFREGLLREDQELTSLKAQVADLTKQLADAKKPAAPTPPK